LLEELFDPGVASGSLAWNDGIRPGWTLLAHDKGVAVYGLGTDIRPVPDGPDPSAPPPIVAVVPSLAALVLAVLLTAGRQRRTGDTVAVAAAVMSAPVWAARIGVAGGVVATLPAGLAVGLAWHVSSSLGALPMPARRMSKPVIAIAALVVSSGVVFAAVAWLVVAWLNEKKPKLLGLLTGAVAGLATVTPAAGYVSPTTAVIIGLVAGVVCYYAVEMKNKLQWDDALDVWGVHGVGGFLGIVMLGIFANKQFNPAGANGLLYGDPTFLLKQVVAVTFSSVWAFVFTYAMLRIIDVFTPVKVTEMSEEIGLDESIHGEHAYEEAPEHEDLVHADVR